MTFPVISFVSHLRKLKFRPKIVFKQSKHSAVPVCGVFDDSEYGEHTGVGFVEMSEIFSSQDPFVFETELVDGLYKHV